MPKVPLGKIENVEDINSVFESEPRDFTPWLNSHLDDLGKLLKLDIVENRIENVIGDFFCDIVAKDSITNKPLIIENQFGDTDHDHLGKIFTYASGLDAGFVIWIAQNFREEHKKALEWLNEKINPDAEVSFFGIEIGLIRIGQSNPAPKFNIVVKPNNWERNVKIVNRDSDSERDQKYYEYFSKLAKAWDKIKPTSMRSADPKPKHDMAIGIGRTGLRYMCRFSRSELIVELVIDNYADKNKTVFEEFQAHKTEIQKEIPEIEWPESSPNVQRWHPGLRKKLKGEITDLNETDVEESVAWASSQMKRLAETCNKYLRFVRS